MSELAIVGEGRPPETVRSLVSIDDATDVSEASGWALGCTIAGFSAANDEFWDATGFFCKLFDRLSLDPKNAWTRKLAYLMKHYEPSHERTFSEYVAAHIDDSQKQ